MQSGIPNNVPVTYQLQHRKCRTGGCSTCRTGPGHGPYWYARWWDYGKRHQEVKYIGTSLPPGIEVFDRVSELVVEPVLSLKEEDEITYLQSLREEDTVGIADSSTEGYYPRILKRKYPQSEFVMTEDHFSLQSLRETSYPFTARQRLRKRAFDQLKGSITKKQWLQVLEQHQLSLFL